MVQGDLIKWVDYTYDLPVERIGLYVGKRQPTDEWNNIVVFHDGELVHWVEWQCEVIYESR